MTKRPHGVAGVRTVLHSFEQNPGAGEAKPLANKQIRPGSNHQMQCERIRSVSLPGRPYFSYCPSLPCRQRLTYQFFSPPGVAARTEAACSVKTIVRGCW